MILTAAHIKMFKKANYVNFNAFASDNGLDHSITLQYVDPVSEKNVFLGELNVKGNVFAYGDDSKREVSRLFGWLGAASASMSWKTVTNFIRAGDAVSLSWTLGNDSLQMKEAGFSHDYLDLVVVRGKKTYTFRLLDAITDSPNFRMVRFK